MSSRSQGWRCKYNLQVLQVVHIQYMSTLVLQLRMLLDIFQAILNISLLIACLLHVNYWSHARDVDCGKISFFITMLSLKCLVPLVLFTNLLVRLWEILKWISQAQVDCAHNKSCSYSLEFKPPPQIGSSLVSMSFLSYDHNPHSEQSSLETISAGYNDSKILKRVILLTCLAFKG
jgi:hypothetical protein